MKYAYHAYWPSSDLEKLECISLWIQTNENYQWYTVRPKDREGKIIFDETKTAGGFATEGMIYISYLSKDLARS